MPDDECATCGHNRNTHPADGACSGDEWNPDGVAQCNLECQRFVAVPDA